MEINQKRPSDRQPASDALPPVSDARLERPRHSDEQRLQRWLLGGVGVIGLSALSLLAGCPGNLENPQRFEGDASTSQAGGSGASIPPCVTTLFAAPNGVCSGSVCHTGGPNAGAGLDLSSPGVVQRLLDVPATHGGVDMTAANVDCPSAKLIDSSNPNASWLLIKVQNYSGNCGSPMPLIGSINSTEITCIASWVNSFGSSSGGSTSSGSGGASSTSGGASSTSGGAPSSGGSGGSSGGNGSAGASGSGVSGAAGKSGGGSGGASSTAGAGGN